MHIDAYIDKKWISSVRFSPEKMSPAISFHLKVNSGKFAAIGKCNPHGGRMTESNI